MSSVVLIYDQAVKWAECGYSKKDDKDQDVFVSEAICTILFISKP